MGDGEGEGEDDVSVSDASIDVFFLAVLFFFVEVNFLVVPVVVWLPRLDPS